MLLHIEMLVPVEVPVKTKLLIHQFVKIAVTFGGRGLRTIATKLSNFVGCLGCLFPLIAGGVFIHAIFNGSVGIAFLLLLVACGLGIILFAKAQTLEDQEVETHRKILHDLPVNGVDTSLLPTVVGADALAKVTLDGDKQQIYLWRAQSDEGELLAKPQKNMMYKTFSYPLGALESVAVVEDDNILSTTNQTDKTVGKSHDNEEGVKLKKITLLLQFEDEKYPFHPIHFYNQPNLGLLKNSADYKKVIEKATEWFDRLVELDCVKVSTEKRGSASEIPMRSMADRAYSQGQDDEITEESSQRFGNQVENKYQEGYANEMKEEENTEKQTVSESQLIEDKHDEVEECISNEHALILDSEKIEVSSDPVGNELSYFEKLILQNKEQLTSERKK